MTLHPEAGTRKQAASSNPQSGQLYSHSHFPTLVLRPQLLVEAGLLAAVLNFRRPLLDVH